RNEVAAIRPDLDESRNRSLLGIDAAVRGRAGLRGRTGPPFALRAAGRRPAGEGIARTLGERRLDRSLRELRAFGAGQGVEIASPRLLYARRIAKVLFVEGIEKGGIAAKERCRFEHGEAQRAKR